MLSLLAYTPYLAGPEQELLSRVPTSWVGAGSLLTLVLAGGYAMISGRLVSHRSIKTLTTNWEARIEQADRRADEWKAAQQTTEEARVALASQLERALDAFESTTLLLTAVHEILIHPQSPRQRGSR